MIPGDGLQAYMARKCKLSKRVRFGILIFRVGLFFKSYRIEVLGDKIKRSGLNTFI